MKTALIVVFIAVAAVAGYALQEETGACLPEHHQAEQENKQFCHCVAMGGYQLCHADKPFSYQEWREENERRAQDVDKKGKPKQGPIPQCSMACREDKCECCQYLDRFHKKDKASGPVITIPYDNL